MRRFLFSFGLFTSLVVMIGFCAVKVKVTDAKSIGVNVPWNTSYAGILYHSAGVYQGVSGSWQLGLSSPNITISRNASVFQNGVEISDGASVAVGDTVSFTAPVADADIFWFGTGFSNDSPYGYWLSGALKPASVASTDSIGIYPSLVGSVTGGWK